MTTSGARRFTLITWNLGYAGLGAAQDFKVDGGTHWRPETRAEVDQNLAGIVEWIQSHDADLYLLQEVARPSFVTRGVDVLAGIRGARADHETHYFRDVRTRLLPGRLGLDVGQAIVVRPGLTAEMATVPLPLEPPRALGLFRRKYQVVTVRVRAPDDGRDWIVGNLHLAAFDDGGRVRRAQLDAVRDMAVAESANGHVVLGGDWNLRLVETDFAHSTDERFLFWVHDLPDGAFPDGWRVAADPRTPSARTNHQPYVAGENYTTVIDGYVVAPEVRVHAVETFDLAFRHSDHQPVRIEIGIV